MKLEVRKSGYKLIFLYIILLVDHKAITHNPAYEEGKLHCLTSSCIIIIHNIVHIVEMRSRRVELESNPSYITVQPSRTCTADYENVI